MMDQSLVLLAQDPAYKPHPAKADVFGQLEAVRGFTKSYAGSQTGCLTNSLPTVCVVVAFTRVHNSASAYGTALALHEA